MFIERLVALLLLFAGEFAYLRIADRFNIIDSPNQRSSHKKNVLRGGGIIFLLGVWMYAFLNTTGYPLFIGGMTLIASVAFIDDVCSLSPRFRFFVQFVAMFLLLQEAGMLVENKVWFLLPTMILGVCIINAYNFMDGINGMTGAFSLMVLFTFWLLNREMAFIDATLIELLMISALVFCFFNFRNQAICFAGDVGSVGMAYCVIFILLKLVLFTGNVTYLLFLVVYGIDTVLTIFHRLLLHENLLQPHRKHLFQLLANEGGHSHVTVSITYVLLQLAISLGYIYLPIDKWLYSVIVTIGLVTAYLIIERKLYPKHKEYLKSLSCAVMDEGYSEKCLRNEN